MTFDPNDPTTFRGWGSKPPTGWGVWIFLGVCAAVAAALAVVLGG